jgi:hypothetical protein
MTPSRPTNVQFRLADVLAIGGIYGIYLTSWVVCFLFYLFVQFGRNKSSERYGQFQRWFMPLGIVTWILVTVSLAFNIIIFKDLYEKIGAGPGFARIAAVSQVVIPYCDAGTNQNRRLLLASWSHSVRLNWFGAFLAL